MFGRKKHEGTSYLATIFPLSGPPYEEEVQADEHGNITHEGKTWNITPNSTWVSGKTRRIVLPEAVAESFQGGLLAGKYYMTCAMFFYYVKMNLLEQLFNLQNRTPWFKKGSTWVVAGCLIGIVGCLIWLTIASNGNLEDIKDAIDRLTVNGSESSPGSQAGHQPIAPSGG